MFFWPIFQVMSLYNHCIHIKHTESQCENLCQITKITLCKFYGTKPFFHIVRHTPVKVMAVIHILITFLPCLVWELNWQHAH